MNAKDLLINMATSGKGGGGITPTGTLTITENGEYDVTEKAGVDVCVPLPSGKITISANATDIDIAQYATADVAVPAQGMTWKDVFKRNDTSIAVVIEAGDTTSYKVQNYIFDGQTSLQSFSVINNSSVGQVTIGEYAFRGCSSLADVTFYGSRIYLGPSAFMRANLSGNIDFTGVESIEYSCFRESSGISSIALPRIAYIPGQAFMMCSNLVRAEFTQLTSIGSWAFGNSSNMETLILRGTTAVPALLYTDAFTGTKIAAGTGYIYVPDELVDSYKAATNWSTYAAQIKPLSQLPAA